MSRPAPAIVATSVCFKRRVEVAVFYEGIRIPIDVTGVIGIHGGDYVPVFLDEGVHRDSSR